ncbi:hypothetical protein ElyMa_000990500 [Elysia marginata]|uniref:PWWP domain-containing protein n=1 Tax=Elysia marginata TaxID=1093978 RepID=A0AAV4HI19_9GAST|nr:hypothetical protein ElyMa_000990500 [Elysia marginata]
MNMNKTCQCYPHKEQLTTLLARMHQLQNHLEKIHPFPQAPPRKPGQINRKAGKSLIYTSTPVKKMLEETKAKEKQTATKRKLIVETSSDSENEADIQNICDDSDSDISVHSGHEDQGDESVRSPKLDQLNEGDYVLVKFGGKKPHPALYWASGKR